MIQIQFYYPGLDPVIDTVGIIGFSIGLIIAIYFREIKHYPFHVWISFCSVAMVFALLTVEGGALDVFAPGTLRVTAMLILISAEITGAWAALHPDSEEKLRLDN